MMTAQQAQEYDTQRIRIGELCEAWESSSQADKHLGIVLFAMLLFLWHYRLLPSNPRTELRPLVSEHCYA
jgi:hypothetical protein